MKRRDFVFQSGLAAAALTPGIWSGNRLLAMSESPLCGWKIQWRQDTATKLYLAATCDERPLAVADESGLLVAFCRLASETPGQSTWLDAKRPGGEHGPLRIELRHELRNSGSNNGRDLLEAVLTLENRSAKPQTVIVGCATSIQPTPDWSKQNLHLPLAASIGFDVMGEIASAPHKEAQWRLGSKDFVAHYLEPQASDPAVRKPLARLLVPLVDVYHPGVKHRVSLMAGPDRARRFATHKDPNGCRGWTAQTVFTLAPGQKLEDRCYLLIHGGDADKAWDVFHRVAHRDAWPAIDWLAAVKAHYYDFLSASDPEGHRGDGYDAAVPHFREFRVGLATQHGYYPGYGDYIHPDRPRWLAMQNDKHGPVEMSFDKIRGRIEATRQTGAKAAIYMHLVGLDDCHYYAAAELEQAESDIPQEAFKIMLSHSPELYKEAAQAGYPLYISGHTHGGQICLPGGIALVRSAAIPAKMIKGMWNYRTMQGYTSQGVGVSGGVKARFFCPPEVVVITLKKGY